MFIFLSSQNDAESKLTHFVNQEFEPFLLDVISTLYNKPQEQLLEEDVRLSTDNIATIIDHLNEKWEELIDQERMIFCFPDRDPDRDTYLRDITAIQNQIETLEKLNALLEYYRRFDAIHVNFVQI